MATTQNMTLSGGNAATNQYTNYYNQIRSQLMTNPNTIQAQVIQAPQQMQAQQIAAPDPITAQRIEVDRQHYDDIAKERAAYLEPYLKNAIKARREETIRANAATDVDANARGFGDSTWVLDSKQRAKAAEASDIMAAQNEFLGRVGELANQVYENQQNRWLQAELQNEANRLTAEQQNAYYANLVNQFNANALMNADQFNIENAVRVAMQNAEYAMQADMFNNQLYQNLMQYAYGWAGDMADRALAYDAAQAAARGGRGGGGGGGSVEVVGGGTPVTGALLGTALGFAGDTGTPNISPNALQAAVGAAGNVNAKSVVEAAAQAALNAVNAKNSSSGKPLNATNTWANYNTKPAGGSTTRYNETK